MTEAKEKPTTQWEKELTSKARAVKAKVEDMTHDELNDWYEEHVGYRPSVDDPTISPTELAATVAGSMFYRMLVDGVDAPQATCIERRLSDSIKQGTEL